MNIIEALENYKLTLVHDQDTFHLLSTICLYGPLKVDGINRKLKSKPKNHQEKLINLFKSGILYPNSYEEWCISPFGSLTLSILGITQLATAKIAEDKISQNYLSNWMQGLFENETDLAASSLFITRLNLFLCTFEEINTNEITTFKKDILADLYFSTKKEFYVFDAKTFYHKFIFTKPQIKNISIEEFSITYSECRNRISLSNKLLSTGDISTGKDHNHVILLTHFRILSSFISEILDFGLDSSIFDIKELSTALDKILKHDKRLNVLSKKFISRYTSLKGSYSFENELINYYKSYLNFEKPQNLTSIKLLNKGKDISGKKYQN